MGRQAERDRRRRVGILATKYTMDSDPYPRALAPHGIDTAIPDDDERQVVNDIIFSELVQGIFTDRSRATYSKIIEKLCARLRPFSLRNARATFTRRWD
jgi:aspartate racemase